jgi:thiamine pyrophosphate-dependent acetolactate synthase large subunit-like protein
VKASDAVAAVHSAIPEALFVSSLGTATSALRQASADGPHFYLGGAMGCGLAVALGVAEARPQRPVVAILGDGDLVMGAGALWTLSGLRPANLLVVVLDDGRYSITGGQELIAPETTRAVAGALPGVGFGDARSPADISEAVPSLPRPAVLIARIEEAAWPGPSPFVDPPLVRRRFAARTAAGV